MTSVTVVETVWRERDQFDQSLAVSRRMGEVNLEIWVSNHEEPLMAD